MAKSKHVKLEQAESLALTEDNNQASIKLFSTEEIMQDQAAYKAAYQIPDNAYLAFNVKELPRFFYQGDTVFFKDALPHDENDNFSTPLWFVPVTDPQIHGALYEMHLARTTVKSLGINVAN